MRSTACVTCRIGPAVRSAMTVASTTIRRSERIMPANRVRFSELNQASAWASDSATRATPTVWPLLITGAAAYMKYSRSVSLR